jgi:putative hydrolase of the HAD superfamily
MNHKYRHLLFDLDHTLWDFHTNSADTLQELFDEFKLSNHFPDFDTFHSVYEEHNLKLWSKYRDGLITKKDLNFERFNYPLTTVGIDNPSIAVKFAEEYLRRSPLKKLLMPGAIEILEYLKPKYKMHIITNGFLEVQNRKLEVSGLSSFFDKIFISEIIGVQKPDSRFFEYVIKNLDVSKKDCIVIGDSYEADILGAQNFGLHHVFYNANRVAHKNGVMHEISSLEELKQIL